MPPSDEPQTVVGAAASVTKSLVTALPAGYLILLILNIGFILFVMWFLEGQLRQRDAMAEQLFDRCMEIALPAHNIP